MPRRLARVLAIFFAVIPTGLLGQSASYAFQPRPNPIAYPSNVQITYGGRIIMDLGNYDVVFGSPLGIAPGSEELSPYGDNNFGVASPQIIFQGDSGMQWDGQAFFNHPAYPRYLIDRYQYRNRVVGREGQQYPPVPQPVLPQRERLTVTEERPELSLGRITPAPLLGLPDGLPDICRDYPYAIQCRPPTQSVDPGKIVLSPPGEKFEPFIPHPAPAPKTERLQPLTPLPGPVQKAIVILNSPESADACTYELLSLEGNFSHTLLPGQKHVIRVERDWQIRFESEGMGVRTYRLHSGQTYRFRKNQSDVWELQRLRKSSRAKVTPAKTP